MAKEKLNEIQLAAILALFLIALFLVATMSLPTPIPEKPTSYKAGKISVNIVNTEAQKQTTKGLIKVNIIPREVKNG